MSEILFIQTSEVKLGNSWAPYVNKQKADDQRDLADAKKGYAAAANERLSNIANGGNPSALFSPWLAMKQTGNDIAARYNEAALSGDSMLHGSQAADQREADYNNAVAAAQKMWAAKQAAGQGTPGTGSNGLP